MCRTRAVRATAVDGNGAVPGCGRRGKRVIVLDLLGIVVPVFVCAIIGFVWAKLGKAFDSETITGLTVQIGTPCLVFDTLTRLDLSLHDFGTMALATAVAVGCFGVLAVV